MRQPQMTRRTWLRSAAVSAAATGLAMAGSPSNGIPWLAEVQRPPANIPADAPRLSPLLVDEHGASIQTLAAWQKQRESIRRWWLDFLGPLATARHAAPPLEVIDEDRPDGVVRRLVRYEVEPGSPVEAYLLRPSNLNGRRPGAAIFHQTVSCSIRESAGVEGRPELAFGLQLAKRGYVALCPRNFLWSNNQTLAIPTELKRFQSRHPDSKGMARMVFDALVAVDILTSLPEVDPQRIGAAGHSLGAKEVLYLAALDERVRVAVSSEGGIGMRFTNWHDPWYLGEEVRRAGFSHEHHELLSLVAPRAFLLLGGDSADGAKSWPFIDAVLPVYRLFGSPARVGLLNHGKGHTVPPDAAERFYGWFDAFA